MELSNAFQRIVGQYWRLIVAFMLVAVGLMALVRVDDAQTYTASTRLVLDTEDPESQTESTSIADTAKAIATSPSQVKQAMAKARVTGRDPAEVAEKDVSLQALGASSVLELSVSDRSPEASAAISNALADRVIEARLAVTSGQLRQVLANLASRLDKLSRRISQLDARIDSAPPRKLPDLLRQRDRLTRQRGTLESERVTALSTDAQRHTPAIISPADVPHRPDASRLLPDLALGALLGLVVGVGVAALIETLRPTLVRGEALAAEFDTPLLGTLPSPTGDLPLEDARRVALRMRLAAKAAGLRQVGLLGLPEDLDMRPLAERLRAVSREVDGAESPTPADASRGVPITPALPGSATQREQGGASRLVAAGDRREVTGSAPEREQGDQAAAARPAFGIHPYDLTGATRTTNGTATGLTLVLPTPVKKAEVDQIKHLLSVSLAPLLGVIAYPASCRSRQDHPTDNTQERNHRGQ